MNKHTPGKWNCDGNRELKTIGWFSDFYVKDDNGMPIANVRKEEDTHLIASAPELLEACKKAVNEYHLNGNCADSIAELKQAIAKAEGK